jgi:hypothetical protein
MAGSSARCGFAHDRERRLHRRCLHTINHLHMVTANIVDTRGTVSYELAVVLGDV